MLVAPFLGVLGFTPAGIKAGSFVAIYQSSIGNVVAPSVFSTLQSAAMGGYGVPIVDGAVYGAGVVTAAGGALFQATRAGNKEKEDVENEEKQDVKNEEKQDVKNEEKQDVKDEEKKDGENQKADTE